MTNYSEDFIYGMNKAAKDRQTMSVEECKAWLEEFTTIGEYKTLGQEKLQIAMGYAKGLGLLKE